jgi:hypothetical protein
LWHCGYCRCGWYPTHCYYLSPYILCVWVYKQVSASIHSSMHTSSCSSTHLH